MHTDSGVTWCVPHLLIAACMCAPTSIKETDGTVKGAVRMKSGLSNVSAIHFQNVACLDASSSKKRQSVFTKMWRLPLWKPLCVSTALWLSKAITGPVRFAAIWCIVLFPVVSLAYFGILSCPQLSDASPLSRLCLSLLPPETGWPHSRFCASVEF